jgi:pilus assembly protein CpaE
VARTVRAIVAVDPALDVDSVANSVSQGENVEVLAVYSDLEEARGHLDELPFDVLVVASAGYSERALLLIDSTERLTGEPAVLVLSEGSSNGYVRRVLESGADDILMLPQTKDQVAFAIRKIMARRDTAAGEGVEPARLIVVLGPKGGTGKTLTSTNLAVALSRMGQSVALVDIDLQFGDVALTLGLAPESTFHDLAIAGGVLDQEVLEHYLVRHSSHRAGPTRPARSAPS